MAVSREAYLYGLAMESKGWRILPGGVPKSVKASYEDKMIGYPAPVYDAQMCLFIQNGYFENPAPLITAGDRDYSNENEPGENVNTC